MSDDGKVIDFIAAKAAVEENSLHVERPALGKYCRHRRVDVFEESYRVACRDCKEPLDPHQVLLEYARQERRFWHLDKERKEKREALRVEVEELAKEVARLKSRRAYHQRKLEEVEQ